jgi:hypothetical protein
VSEFTNRNADIADISNTVEHCAKPKRLRRLERKERPGLRELDLASALVKCGICSMYVGRKAFKFHQCEDEYTDETEEDEAEEDETDDD